MKRASLLLAVVYFALAAVSTFAHGGGKAEPLRIKFAKGKFKISLTGTLKGDEEQEFVFRAKKGQTVHVTNPDSVRFAYKLFNDETKQESTVAEPAMEFVVPETGDYMLFVRRANTSRKAAKFSISFAIK